MMSLASIQKGGQVKAPITVIHGGPGIGKTTFAAGAPAPVFIRTEDGLGNLTPDAFPVAATWADVVGAMAALYQEQHEYKTVVVDSLSALEPLIWKQVAQDNDKDNIEDLGYGKGYVIALDYWGQFLQWIAALRNDRGMLPVLIAHSAIARYDSPEVDPYDRFQIKLHTKAFQLLYERSDIIGFAAWRTHVVKTEVGFDKKIARGVGTGERLLHLVEKPAYIAKNRFGLPDTLPLHWPAFADALTQATTPPTAPATEATQKPSQTKRT
jgi:hypothetical protein